MSDFFTLKTIYINEELGMIIKNFRVEYKVTAKSITDNFNKASSYISKLEKGDVKKIDVPFFVDLCNYISPEKNGVIDFVKKASSKFLDCSTETQNTIMNIDDLVIEHAVNNAFISEINKYMEEHSITVENLYNEINKNDDLKDLEGDLLKNIPSNEWYSKIPSKHGRFVIKLAIPLDYLTGLLSSNIQRIHAVIAEAILYTLFKLGGESSPKLLADSKLKLYDIIKYRGGNIISINEDELDEYFGGLEPQTKKSLQHITSGLRVITAMTKNMGVARIDRIDKNITEDIGFFFAYMAQDLVDLEKQPKETKLAFLKDLKELIKKHTESSESKIDLYMDDEMQ